MQILNFYLEVFGIDISDSSLKIIKLKKRRRGLSLDSFGETSIEPGLIDRGEIKNEDALAKIIKQALLNIKGKKIKTKYVICSLPEEKAFLRVIQMPKIREEELREAIYFEVENHVPLPIEEIYFDFQVITPISNGLDHLDVLIIAMPKKIVDTYVSVLEKAGLIVQALEIESLSVVRALIKNEKSLKPLLLINYGKTRTIFNIFSGHSLRLSSSNLISSDTFTEAIAKNLEIDLVQAEKLKIKYGLTEKYRSKTENNKENKIERKKIFESLVPVLTDLAEQIKIHLSYYQTHVFHEHLSSTSSKNKKIEKILFFGEGSPLKGLIDFLSSELGISTELANPWPKISSSLPKEALLKESLGLGHITALGLALRGAEQDD